MGWDILNRTTRKTGCETQILVLWCRNVIIQAAVLVHIQCISFFFSKTVPANLPVNITSLICCGGEITITNSSRRPWRKHNHGKRAWLKGRAKDEGNGIDSCRKCVWVHALCVCVCVHMCFSPVQTPCWGPSAPAVRTRCGRGEAACGSTCGGTTRTHPHTSAANRLLHPPQQCLQARTHTHTHTHTRTHTYARAKGRETRCINARRMKIESRWKKCRHTQLLSGVRWAYFTKQLACF